MSIQTLCIPQLGEGLHEALLVEYLCEAGARVRRDQPIYVMETDKATTEVESPYDGVLIGWLVEPGQVLPIGFEIGRIEATIAVEVSASSGTHGSESSERGETSERGEAARSVNATAEHQAEVTFEALAEALEEAEEAEVETDRRFRIDARHSESGRTAPAPHRRRRSDGVLVPPRTRRHLRELGLAEQFDSIPARGPKLMPDDVDRFVTSRQDASNEPLDPSAGDSASDPLVPSTVAPADMTAKGDSPVGLLPELAPKSTGWYDEAAVPKGQLTLNYRLLRGLQQVVPATAIAECDWTRIGLARQATRDQGGPTGFLMMLWCVARSLAEHAPLRSTLVRDGRILRTYRNVDLGVAVALPDDRLVTAVIPQADTLSQADFWRVAADRIGQARTGRDQANDRVTFTVSNVGTFGLQLGVPVVVPPAVATLALGEVQPRPVPCGDGWRFESRASLALTFDHRVLNGLGAGRFLADLRRRIAEFSLD